MKQWDLITRRMGDNFYASLSAAPRHADDNGSRDTPLIRAAHRGHIEVYEMLLQAGANPDLKDNNGRTAALLLNRSDKREASKRAGHTRPS